MGHFAWQNLLTRPLRTFLALVGLSVPILGVLGLFSVSDGLRNLVGDTLNRIKGVMVLGDGMPTPVFSRLPASVGDRIRALPGVRAVAPEVWSLAPPIDNVSLIAKSLSNLQKSNEQKLAGMMDAIVIQGQDIAAHKPLKSAVYPSALKDGRFLELSDQGSKNVVISKKISLDFKDKAKNPKKPGDSLKIGPENYRSSGSTIPARSCSTT